MTKRNHKDDILIADGEWIEFISLEGRYDQAVEVDEHLAGLWPLIDRLETQCVAECCGFDAYDFTGDGIDEALLGLDCVQLHEACEQAKRDIEATGSGVVMSSKMNNLADRRVFIRLLDHLDSRITERTTQLGNAPDATGADDR